MDTSRKVQGSVHSFLLVLTMCQKLWVHIKPANFRGHFIDYV